MTERGTFLPGAPRFEATEIGRIKSDKVIVPFALQSRSEGKPSQA